MCQLWATCSLPFDGIDERFYFGEEGRKSATRVPFDDCSAELGVPCREEALEHFFNAPLSEKRVESVFVFNEVGKDVFIGAGLLQIGGNGTEETAEFSV